MGILRSDYLLHQEGERTSMKNVEVNTIASSFGFLATQLSEIYRNYLKENSSTGLNFVPSESSFQLVRAISQSMDQFQATYPGTSGPYESTIAVMLVQKNEKNTFDQEGLIQLLVNTYQKKMIRLDWQTFREKAALKDRTYYM